MYWTRQSSRKIESSYISSIGRSFVSITWLLLRKSSRILSLSESSFRSDGVAHRVRVLSAKRLWRYSSP